MQRDHRSALCRRLLRLLLAAALLCLAGCGAKQTALSWQEQYDLGVRYLGEGNYEEAVIAFEAAIEIDPKRPEAYAGLADAYLAAGDEAAAKAALEQGVFATGDEDLSGHLEELTPSATPQPSPSPAPAGGLFAGPFLTPEELELMQLDLEAAAALVRADGLYDPEDVARPDSDDARYAKIGIRTSSMLYLVCSLKQKHEADTITWAHFYGSWDSGGDIPSPVHIRGICLGQTREQVMTVLGFTREDISAVGDRLVRITRLQGGNEDTWKQLDLLPEKSLLTVQHTEQGIVGWVTSLYPAGESGAKAVEFRFQDGTTGAYANSVRLDFFGEVLNKVTVGDY